ncbi:MAG TPA: glycerol-3-phosphate dehydrogenase/oxidase [Acidimicrobiales bacterium]|nr:glycerol-3-phosphate dehydrogenase/oxidase [Acidimicrobiales bacterium]
MSGRGWFDRTSAIARMEDETLDVLVIGGGVTGCGCALDAAARGLKVGLIERDDFASGTSSKSSKMVHGGLRYLQQGDIRLVYEALRERQILMHNAPHLVETLPFLLPVLTGRDSPVPRKLARLLGSAMWAYDLTGGARIGKLHKRLSAEEAIEHFPTVKPERMNSAYLYYDARTDDARLTLTLARTAAIDHGAYLANGVAMEGVIHDEDGRVRAIEASADGRRFAIRAHTVVNATGVWADDIRALDEGTHPDSIRPAKGIHIAVPWEKVRNDIAAVLPAGGGRSIFVVPWYDTDRTDGTPGLTYLGTTDTDYDGPLDDPQCTPEDVAYLLDAANAALTTELGPDDVLGSWAGLRPLVKASATTKSTKRKKGATKDLSRRHQVQVAPSGVVTITGGKLTTYRQMAVDTIDTVTKAFDGRKIPRSPTRSLPLHGADGADAVLERHTDDGLDRSTLEHLVGRYGADADIIDAMVTSDPDLGRPLVPGLPYLRAEVVFAARYEMARDVDDVLSRRTRARLLARDASLDAAADVAALIGDELGLDDAARAAQVEAYREAIETERRAPGLPVTGRQAVTQTR